MRRILITGASGNVGTAVLRHLVRSTDQILKAAYRFPMKEDEVYFNFDDLTRTRAALEKVDVLFLLRPPHISDTNEYFRPLIAACKDMRVGHIVFLSVQGVEKSSIIPHHRIERLIIESTIPYTFVRPSYFMQNLTTTLKRDVQQGEIFLPAGRAPFLWVDVENIGQAIAAIIQNLERHQNKAYEITGNEYFTFNEVAKKLTTILGKNVRYRSPTLLSFILRKRKEGMEINYILVLIMLHYLARFQARPPVTTAFEDLTGLKPNSLDNFISDHRKEWE
jgi:uncharacterized protein YbjT (DUF2867 family)